MINETKSYNLTISCFDIYNEVNHTILVSYSSSTFVPDFTISSPDESSNTSSTASAITSDLTALPDSTSADLEKTESATAATTDDRPVSEILRERIQKIARAEKEKRMKEKGFLSQEDVGYIFPGIDPLMIDAALKRRRNSEKDNVFYPDPEVSIERVTMSGVVYVEFNQDMLHPSKFNSSIYRGVLELKLRPKNQRLFVEGQYVTLGQNDTRSLA